MLHWNRFDRAHKIYVWMAGIFVTCLIIANLIGSLLFSFRLPFLADPVLLSAGIIPFPVTFILTDLLNEFYGKEGARFVTWLGFGMSILVFLLLSVGTLLPVPADSPMPQNVYFIVSTQYSGMFIASLTAYLIGQMLDIQVFHLFRRITKHRLIWVRATGSTVVSQLFDSLIVTSIAFWGQMPLEKILHLAAGNYTWKFIIAVGITPLLYLGHAALQKLIPRQEATLEADYSQAA